MAPPGSRPGGRWPLVAGLAALAVAAQLYGLYRATGPPSAPWFPHADKVQHAVGFALPVALVLGAYTSWSRSRGARPTRRAWAVVVAAFAAHGVASELIQHFFYTSRSGDPLDVLADGTGTAVGAVVAAALLRPHRALGPEVDALDRPAPSRGR